MNPTLAQIAFYVAIGLEVICIVWTFYRWPTEEAHGPRDEDKAKLREFLIQDIRANNQYCSVYLAIIGVIASVVASNSQAFKPVLVVEHLWPFGLAFTAGSISALFFPAGYGPHSFETLRYVWLRSVLCEQIVVIFTWYGIFNAFDVLT
jgi:hypothetical protein